MGFGICVPPCLKGTASIRDYENEEFDIAGAYETWHEKDLSVQVPAEAKALIIHVQNYNAGEENHVGFRMKGSSGLLTPYTETGGLYRQSHAWAIVGLDNDKLFEALRENFYTETLLVGFLGDNWTFFKDKIVLAHLDIGPQSQWYTKDLSTYIPANATAIAFEVNNYHDYALVAAGVRKYGSSDNRTGAMYHCWGVVGVSQQRVDLYFTPQGTGGGSFSNIALLGYCIGGLDTWATAPEITPVKDDTWRTVGVFAHKQNPVWLWMELSGGLTPESHAHRKNAHAHEGFDQSLCGHSFCGLHPNTPTSDFEAKYTTGSAAQLFLLAAT